ncbi:MULTISPECIES: helix-turn-helix domain-containing protein [Micromonospora]|uniref:Transcriptional regulator n=1 Tax=Micromonospora gifhornensis TaxID=84594 RepID=A0ABQ4IIR1_9ACTN|nr:MULTISPECIES: helix-turn-helix transcriptional regulator [Micromonospora]PMR58960.1 transcriptional regulator [Verrucosispora sp. ts21]GIJ17798.1 transcriptional regulator [Micromonospora gifhornensis]
MVLLRRVIGDALRARRQGQHRTLREVSSAANVSLGYLSEIERGQKEPSSELLAAICDALGARLSELLREVSDTVALAEQLPGVLVPMQDESAESTPVTATVGAATNRSVRQVSADGVAVSVRQESPLKATLRSTRVRPADRTDRDVVCAA